MPSDANSGPATGHDTGPRIRALSHVLSNQIAAGEVIERPASVVKELLENSLDAGARRIEIDVASAGIELVRVRDDGVGIHPDDLDLALHAHATSKISSLADLQRIRSLGFRGEALPSIAAVSRLGLSSRTAVSTTGWEILSDGGIVGERQPAAGPPGTVVSVRDLFFNTPARRKFLRTERTELRHVEDVVRRVALSRFDVALSFRHNDREIFRLPAVGDPQEQGRRVSKLCGQAFLDNALVVEVEAAGMRLRGWLGVPSAARGNTDLQFFFINGRSVRDNTARHAIRQAYDNRIPSGRHPAYVLYLDVDPSAVDVNVHPAKQEVRYREARLVHDFIWRNLARGFDDALTEPALAGEGVEPGTVAAANQGTSRNGVSDSTTAYQSFYRGAASTTAPAVAGGYRALAAGGRVTVIDNRYVVAAGATEILLVDLAAARREMVARVLRAPVNSATPPSRPLLLPVSVDVGERLADSVENLSDVLEPLGFEFRRTAPGALATHAVPAVLGHVPAGDLTETVLQWSGECGAPTRESLCEALAARAAEHLDDLLFSNEAMESFLRALEVHANALSEARAWLRLDASAMELLIRQSRR